MVAKKDTAEQLLKALADADNEVATATGVLKAKKEAYEQVADRVFTLLDEQGTEVIRNAKIGLQVSIGETETDTIEDYEKFTQFVIRNKIPHVFQRRLSPNAVKEWNEAHPNKQLPGLGKFAKRRLHVTKISK